MRGCFVLTRMARHQRHDKGGNAHNFPFDTLTRVYRDSVYLPQEKYRGNPMHPERGSGVRPSPAESAPQPPRSDVTNHVGNIGVMSPVATKLSEWLAQLQEQDQEKGCADDSKVVGRACGTAHRATPIVRSRPTSSSSSASFGDTGTAEQSHLDDEAMRKRLRAHLFSDKRKSERQVSGRQPRSESSTTTATVSSSPRHSGVQVEILSLYRRMLREVARMDDADTRHSLAAYIRQEYDKQRDVPRKNIMKIEWKLNYGKRKLEELQAMSKNTKFTIMR
ncbi:hypothetical protein JKF63_06605 [Porcisia hertigi]|uniref:Complex 1 LYR protein domain-containing protein n=1 Tax=Porcisia hertigi TaxID=2761500 RepID=A0A836IVG4_9TRYP|nr:hypothetical protein JKF63_06605 [Porcisia hertigi]